MYNKKNHKPILISDMPMSMKKSFEQFVLKAERIGKKINHSSSEFNSGELSTSKQGK